MIFLTSIKVSKHTITSSHLLYLVYFEVSIFNVLYWTRWISIPPCSYFNIYFWTFSSNFKNLSTKQFHSLHFGCFLVCVSSLPKSTHNYYVVLTLFFPLWPILFLLTIIFLFWWQSFNLLTFIPSFIHIVIII